MPSGALTVADWRLTPAERPPRSAVLLLGGAQLLATAFLLAFALLPAPEADAARPFNAAMAAVAALIALLTFTVIPRARFWVWDVSLGLSSLVLAFVITVESDAAGQVLNGTGLVMLALLAGLFRTQRRLIAHLSLMLVAYLAAIVISDVLPTILFGVITGVMVVTVGVVVHWLVVQLHRLSLVDALTGALNRRGLEQQAAGVRSVAARSGLPTSVAIIDLDAFKAYNDTHGHAAGDALLGNVVLDLQVHLRPHDLVARYGGDEFVVLLPGSTEPEAGTAVQRAADASGHPWTWGLSLWRDGESLYDAIDRADRVLYDAKRARTAAGQAVPEQRTPPQPAPQQRTPGTEPVERASDPA